MSSCPRLLKIVRIYFSVHYWDDSLLNAPVEPLSVVRFGHRCRLAAWGGIPRAACWRGLRPVVRAPGAGAKARRDGPVSPGLRALLLAPFPGRVGRGKTTTLRRAWFCLWAGCCAAGLVPPRFPRFALPFLKKGRSCTSPPRPHTGIQVFAFLAEFSNLSQ